MMESILVDMIMAILGVVARLVLCIAITEAAVYRSTEIVLALADTLGLATVDRVPGIVATTAALAVYTAWRYLAAPGSLAGDAPESFGVVCVAYTTAIWCRIAGG